MKNDDANSSEENEETTKERCVRTNPSQPNQENRMNHKIKTITATGVQAWAVIPTGGDTPGERAMPIVAWAITRHEDPDGDFETIDPVHGVEYIDSMFFAPNNGDGIRVIYDAHEAKAINEKAGPRLEAPLAF